MDGPGLWKKNQEETKIFFQIGLNFFPKWSKFAQNGLNLSKLV
jgi:hypothetical protein